MIDPRTEVLRQLNGAVSHATAGEILRAVQFLDPGSASPGGQARPQTHLSHRTTQVRRQGRLIPIVHDLH